MSTTPATELLRPMEDPTGSDWTWAPQPEARSLVEGLMLVFLERCPDAARFGERLIADTGTHITDWIGVILTPDTPETRNHLEASGYTPRQTEFVDADIHYAFEHRLGTFPDILLSDSDRMSVGLRVDSIADFFAANQLRGIENTQGEPLARARWAHVFQGERAAMWVMERHGYDGYHLAIEPAENRIAAAHHLERFRSRPRCFNCDGDGLADAERSIRAAAEEIGPHWAADLFMASEREFFTRSHCVATSQHTRQRAAGLGWGNTDHLVYAASTHRLAPTLDLFAALGFAARERFALGADDTAHVLEQPVTRSVVVVVTPAGEAPGVSGSWVALLGESLLSAGPAGLSFRADVEPLAAQLGLVDAGGSKIATIPVAPESIEAAAAEGFLDEGVAHSLRKGGRIGTTVTIAPRRDGFRGFTPETLAWRGPGD